MHRWPHGGINRTPPWPRRSGVTDGRSSTSAGGVCEGPGCDCPEDDDGPPFAYAVGQFGLGHPELLVFGLDVHDSLGLLNSLGDRIRAGETLLPGQIFTVGEWPHRIVPETVPNPGEIVFTANRFYRRPDHASVDVIQLTYDDSVCQGPG